MFEVLFLILIQICSYDEFQVWNVNRFDSFSSLSATVEMFRLFCAGGLWDWASCRCLIHKCPFTIITVSFLYYFKENVCSVNIRIEKKCTALHFKVYLCCPQVVSFFHRAMLTVGLTVLSLWPFLSGLFEKAKVTTPYNSRCMQSKIFLSLMHLHCVLEI